MDRKRGAMKSSNPFIEINSWARSSGTANMESVFAKIAENTVKFNLGDEEECRVLFEPLYKELSKEVGVIRDKRYGHVDGNLLDVLFPLSKEAGKPVFLFVHGGGFFSGDKGWSEKV